MHANYSLKLSSIEKLNISYILDDGSWTKLNTSNKQFIQDNCTLIAYIPQNLTLPPYYGYSNIKIYKINK